MKRILVAAGDRKLTKFVAEALLQRSVTPEEPSMRSSDWDISRAHSSLELSILINHGRRKFDVVILDQGLPGPDCLEIVADVRRFEMTRNVSIFVMSERGRDQLVRRIATERYFVTGFIDKPVSAMGLRACLASLGRQRRVLMIDANTNRAHETAIQLRRAGYLTDIVGNGTLAINSLSYGRPDAIMCATELPDIPGTHVCSRLKQNNRTMTIPILLFGEVEQLSEHPIDENAHRADDFLRSPFSNDELLEKIASLAGASEPEASDNKTDPEYILEAPFRPTRRKDARRTMLQEGGILPVESSPSSPQISETAPESPFSWSNDSDELTRTTALQQDFDSPPPLGDSPYDTVDSGNDTDQNPVVRYPHPQTANDPANHKRATRRVPCRVSVSLKDGQAVHESQTLNISNGGVMITSTEPLQMGMHLNLSFCLPASNKVITAVGRIAWLSRPPATKPGAQPECVAGVKFSQIAPEQLQLIVDYVNRVAKVVYVAP